MDFLSTEQRSRLMGRIKSTNTSPELFVRSLLHRAGYRYRLHVKKLPGKPDIVLSKYKTVIEVRGCLWHLHRNCFQARIPKTRSAWWRDKLEKNAERDLQHCEMLIAQGWRVVVVWGCVFKKIPPQYKSCFREHLTDILKQALSCSTGKFVEIDREVLFRNDICLGGALWNK